MTSSSSTFRSSLIILGQVGDPHYPSGPEMKDLHGNNVSQISIPQNISQSLLILISMLYSKGQVLGPQHINVLHVYEHRVYLTPLIGNTF